MALASSIRLGAYIEGFPVVNRAYAGGSLDWLAPFPLFTGLGLVTAWSYFVFRGKVKQGEGYH